MQLRVLCLNGVPFTCKILAVFVALNLSVLQAPDVFGDDITMKFVSPKHKILMNELTEKHGFDINELAPLFKEAVILPEILEKFERAPERRLHYYEYRKIFLTESLLAKGHAYFAMNKPLLERVEADYGVPKEIVAAILGVETRFGQPGIEPYRAWDAFNTIYSLYPPRAAFFKEELIAFLKLCQIEGIDPLSVRSSYAGAMGVPQFMPSSFLKYAVDYDGDQRRNLWTSNEDIYASVANYLKEAGWKKGGLIWTPVKTSGNSVDMQRLVGGGAREVQSVASAIKLGIEIPASVNPGENVSFTAYKPEEGQELPLSLFDNFRAIMRYNISVNYALVVTELSEILAKGEAVQGEEKVLPAENPLRDVKPDLKPDVKPDVKPDTKNEQSPNLIPSPPPS